jgi:hypothetical protein
MKALVSGTGPPLLYEPYGQRKLWLPVLIALFFLSRVPGIFKNHELNVDEGLTFMGAFRFHSYLLSNLKYAESRPSDWRRNFCNCSVQTLVGVRARPNDVTTVPVSGIAEDAA